jgi:hypothetical protein
MKKQFLTFVLALIALYSAAQQTKEKDVSNSDKFALKTGVLLQRNFVEIGKFKSVTIEYLETIDLTDKAKAKCLRLTLPAKGEYDSDHIGVIDNDEVDGLIKSLGLIKSNALTIIPSVYTEVSYKTRGGFEAGAYYDEKDKEWNYFLKMSKYDSKSQMFFTPPQLDDLLTLLNTAKAKF